MSNAVSRGPGRGKPNQDHNAGPMPDQYQSSQQFVMPVVSSQPGQPSYQRMPPNQMQQPSYQGYGAPPQYSQPNHYYQPTHNHPPPQIHQQQQYYPRQDYGQYQYQGPQQYPYQGQPQVYPSDTVTYQPPTQQAPPMTPQVQPEPKRQRKLLEIVDPATKKAIEVAPRTPVSVAPVVQPVPLAPDVEERKEHIKEQFKKDLAAAALQDFSVPPPPIPQKPQAAPTVSPAQAQVPSEAPKTPEAPVKIEAPATQPESIITPVSSPQVSETATTTPASGTAESASIGDDVRATPTLQKEESKEEVDDDKFDENDRDQSSPDVTESLAEKTPEELAAEKEQKEAEDKEKKRLQEDALEKRVEQLIKSGDADISNGTFGREFMVTIREIEKLFSRTACPLTPTQLADFGLDIKTMRVADKKPNFTPNWVPNKGSRQQNPYRGRTTTDGTGRGAQQQRDRGGHNKRPPVVRASIERVQRIALPSSKDAWKPERQKASESIPEEEAAIKEVCKKVRALMNKVTPTSQGPLTQEFISYNVSSNDTQLAQVVEIVFDKAVEEPKFCALYAEICKSQVNHELSKNNGKSAFRNKVLTRTQMFFQDKKDIDADKLAIIEKEEDPVKREAMLIEEKQKFRRRKFGVMAFIGHLYRNQLLSTKIVQTCSFELFASILPKENQALRKEDIDEESVHCGLQLIETVGLMLDKSKDTTTVFLDQWFQKLQAAAPFCSNKIRFMILNLVELRSLKWIPRKSTESGPKKLDEIHKDIRQEKIENEKARDQYDRDRDRRHGGGVRPNSNSLRKQVPTSRNSLDRNRAMQHPEQKRAAAAANTKLASSSVQPKNISLSAMDSSSTLGKSKKEWHSGASGGGNTSESAAPPTKSAWGRRDSNDQRKRSTVDEKQQALNLAKDINAMSISARRSTSQNSIPEKTDEDLTDEEKAIRAKIMNTVKSDVQELVAGELSQKEMVESFNECYVGKEKYGSPSLAVVYEMAVRAVSEKTFKDEERKKLALALRLSLTGKTEKQAFIDGATRFSKYATDVELYQDFPNLWSLTADVLMNTMHVPHNVISEEKVTEEKVEHLSLSDMGPVFLAAKTEGNKKYDLFVQVLKRLVEAEIAENDDSVEGISWEFTDLPFKEDMVKEGLRTEMDAVTTSNGKKLSSLLLK